MSDPPPQCLVWLPLMHRLANVENGKTPHGLFINGEKLAGLGGCKVQPCIIMLSHHTHNQSSRHIQANTHTHTYTSSADDPQGHYTLCMSVCVCDALVITSHLQVSRRNTHTLTRAACWSHGVVALCSQTR